MLKIRSSFVISGLLASLLPIPGQVSAADRELLDILLGNGAITQAQYQILLEKEELRVEDVEEIHVELGADGLSISTVDEDFTFELGGRLHLDYAQHEHDARIPSQPNNGFTTRRSRLELNGTLQGVWGWAAEMDFAEDAVEIKDFKIGYEADNFSLYAGNQKQPYSLSLEMSSNDIPFVERSIDNFLVAELTDRALGLRLETSGERWFFAGGLFGDEVDSGEVGDTTWSTMGRLVYAPLLDNDRVLHLGIRGNYRKVGDISSLRFSDRTTDFSALRITDTGILREAETVTMFGPEFGLALGALTVLGEYSTVNVKQRVGESLTFDGWHVGAAYSLTGDTRTSAYRIDAGEFKGAVAQSPLSPGLGQWGGIELVSRYASLDLNDGTFVGGSEEVVETGVNWYPNPNIRFLFNWSHIVKTDESNPVRLYAPGMDIYTLRAQFNY